MYIILAHILIQLIISNKFLLVHTTETKLINTSVELLNNCYSNEENACDPYCAVSDGFYNIDICFHSDNQKLMVRCPKGTKININFLLERKFQSVLHKTRYLEVTNCNNFTHEIYRNGDVREILINMMELNKVTLVYNTDFGRKPTEDFSQFRNVLHLQLIIKSTADIISIPTDIFSEQYQLETLTLSVQGLRNQNLTLLNLTQTHFENLTELRQLDLAGNNIRILDANIFAALTKLNFLNLSRNEIRELPENLLAFQRQLLILDLSHNSLTYLSPQFFDQAPLLWQLKLGGNRLYSTTNLMEILKPLHYLHKLDLSQNKLQTIWSTETSVSTTPSPLKIFRYSNKGINVALAVGLNYITKLQPEKYEGGTLNSIEINLSGNRLREFSLDWLIAAEIACPFEINLENNLIKNMFALQKFFSRTYDCAREIKMTGNPVECDCKFAGIYNANYHWFFNGLHCVQSSTKLIKDLAQLELNELCAWKPVMCPSKCNCYTQSEFLQISCKCWQHIEQLPRPEQVGLKSSVLDISNNNFVVLPLNTTFGYSNVSQLNASYNKITNISLAQLPSNLTVLDLRNNRLKSLNDEFLRTYLNDSTKLQFLYLSENPWYCDCSAQQLLYTIRTNRARIPDIDQLLCDNLQNVTLLTANVRQLCLTVNVEYYQCLIATVLSVALSIIILLCIIALFYKYKLEVKVWLYGNNILRSCIHECELDDHKIFDAFISYAHQDADFVNHTLLPQLEQCEPPFRVCTHERNWLAGAYIPEQIIESVEQSRRTIIVLSQHFIESDWARMEFRTAHQCSLNEGRARIIMIKYGEISNSEFLDKELKAYLDMNTYLDWQDVRFWDKLRFAMPHKVGRERNSDTRMLEINGRMYVNRQVEMNRLRDESV
ncbi:protein toll-like [Bactrocera dorsalis]|uniref:Protein toll-like n=1 Tax=Bactrocera dorsalis TaxID=27457 RepID=A0ABM3J7U2_BACDO|nr:protein toll-like [Bactrocera dorsalis]